ncbi:Lon protease family protein [Pseudogracilibacillus auburnensis]|uniref:Lon protease family protein n=1 Tax=Pseudogracilibacillus auburnensis TaxID=1494959 RepID=UPI001A96CD14|nr:AAA family ATPase [Pseudogracilibacillus auburnensis]MBO1004561.1 AAA family ATPase [Pseudogracilibacillus auburnensis]
MNSHDHASSIKQKVALSPEKLKRTVDYTDFEFETTEQVPTLTSIVGQERGRAVMNFGLNVHKVGYNIYVSGIAGTGKTTFTKSIVKEFAEKDTELFDWCYVHNFEDNYKPKALQLPVGMGRSLKEDMEKLIHDLKIDIPKAFSEESYEKEKGSIIRKYKEKSNQVFEQINDIAKQYGFVVRQSGTGILTIPIVDGSPINEEEYQKLSGEQLKDMNQKSSALQERVLDYTSELRNIEKEAKETIEELDKDVALTAAGFHIEELKKKYKKCTDVITYFEEVQTDILKNINDFVQDEKESNTNPLGKILPQKENNIHSKYGINLLVDNSETKGAPVITADNPTYYHLIGKVEYESRMGVMSTNFSKIKPGFLHYANGGYIIIQAKDIFTKSFAWEGLKRALLHQQLQIENIGEHSGLLTTTSIHPEPIPLDVKVIIIGNLHLYQLLYHYDEDFRKLFKMKADFDVEMDSNLENMTRLASFIHTHCKDHQLLHFDRTAVAKIVEFSTRLAGHQNKLSTRFNQQVEIIYEADAWANMMDDEIVSAKHVIKAIEEKNYHNNLYKEKLQESMIEGTLLIDTDGRKVGQVNGLAVYNLGQYSFGTPSRITATTFVGQNGIINIERESKMSGNIHNKGVYILGGYLGQKFAQGYPLALTAHLAFEQSYGGVDGDSASSTELYALLSSLADVPIDQGLAVTGSVNQKGEIQPIGGVNEKIEGFYEVCKNKGLTGKQGVLIPHQNVRNLMLKDEVIDAVKADTFHIYAVKTVEEGIETLTGIPAGERNEFGAYEENTLYKKVADKLHHFNKISKKEDKIE